ncbi:MAG: type II secretion system F family protein [Planctomycetota bacterium]
MAARIKLKPLAQLCRRVGTSLSAGVDARKTWAREVDRAQGSSRRALRGIYGAISRGQSYAVWFENTGEYFPPLVRDLVSMGEKTGHVDQVFLQLAEHYENLASLRRTYLSGIVLPVLQLLVAAFVVGVLIAVGGVLTGIDGKPVDFLGFGLTGSSGLITYIIFLTCIVIAIGFLLDGWRQGKLGIKQIMKYAIKVPMLGECVRTNSLARMAWSLGLAVDTGMGARQCMATALDSTSNAYYTELKPVVDPILASGVPFNEALRETNAFPLEFLDTLEVGEQSGRITECLNRLSEQYQDRARMQSVILTRVASFAVWGFMAIVVIFLIFRVAMSYIGTINSLL